MKKDTQNLKLSHQSRQVDISPKQQVARVKASTTAGQGRGPESEARNLAKHCWGLEQAPGRLRHEQTGEELLSHLSEEPVIQGHRGDNQHRGQGWIKVSVMGTLAM